MFNPLRFLGRGLPAGAQTCQITAPGVGMLSLAGVPKSDPFIFGRLSRGELFEPHILAALRRLIEPGATVLDVGANIGWFSLCLSRLVGPGGHLIAVEPAPLNLRLLRHNLQANGIKNTIVIAAAAGADDGHIWLRLSCDNAGDHRIGGTKAGAHTVPVKLRRLDTLSIPAASPLIIKMDVQGAEPSVLAGAAKLLSRRPVRLIAEFWPHGLVDCGSSPEALVDQLTRHFQKFWALFQDQAPYQVTPAQLLAMASEGLAPATQMFTDIVCLQADDHEAIAAMALPPP